MGFAICNRRVNLCIPDIYEGGIQALSTSLYVTRVGEGADIQACLEMSSFSQKDQNTQHTLPWHEDDLWESNRL